MDRLSFSFAGVRRYLTAIPRAGGVWLAAICCLGGGLSAAAQSVVGPVPSPPLSRPLPAVRVTLSRTNYRITVDPKTGAPQMPKDVLASAFAQNWPGSAPPPSEFVWHAYLRWDYKPFPTRHKIETQTFTQASPLKIDLNGEVRGGTLTVYAKTQLDGREVLGQAQAQVTADNPSRSLLLRAFPPNRTGLIASKICMAESSMRQFTAASATEPGGHPYVSPTNDIGLMQLNVPSGSVTSADQIWDWRANLHRGLAMLEGKRQTTLAYRASSGTLRQPPPTYTFEARAHLAAVNIYRELFGLSRLQLPSVPPISDAPGSGILPGELDPDHLNLTQREREAIRRYNGGSEYAYDLCMDESLLNVRVLGWVPDPTRGGLDARRGDPNYIHHVLLARSGFTVPAPTKPSKKTRPQRSRKRQA